MKAEGNQPGDSGISGPRTGNCAPFSLVLVRYSLVH